MINHFKTTIKDLFTFLKRPVDQPYINQSTSFKLQRLFSILLVNLLALAIIVPIMLGLEKAGFYELGSHKMNDMIGIIPKWSLILLGVIVIPFFEEIIFRLGLKFKRFYPFQILISLKGPAGDEKRESLKNKLRGIWDRFYKLIFYFAAFAFAIIHLSNFTVDASILLFAPILVAPQFIAGLLMGFIRVKFGFIWGFLLHALNNFIFLAIPLIFMGGPVEKLNVNNDDYSLVIEEIAMPDKTSRSSLFIADSVKFENVTLGSLIAQTLEIDENLLELVPKQPAEKSLNVYLTKKANNLNAKQILMDELQKLYNFDKTNSTVQKQFWQLEITDETLLQKFESNTSNSAGMSYSYSKIKMTGVDLNQFADYLKTIYKNELIKTDNLKRYNTTQLYNFEFAKLPFTEMTEILRTKYGLHFKSKETEMDKVKIEFH